MHVQESNVVDRHQAVMVEEVVEALNIQANGIYVDATFGRGGHASAILQRLSASGKLLAMDKDSDASKIAEKLAANDARFIFQKGAFSHIDTFCRGLNLSGKIQGILLDLGVSSPQLEDASRGFSFLKEGPLDMRMDSTQGQTAGEWINTATESEIADVLKTYGEERFSRRIARAIIDARSQGIITSTTALAEIVKKAHPAWEPHKHPATRSFQAIRILINNELDDLSVCLEKCLEILSVQGRLVVISFHSLEDRIVKRFIRSHERDESSKRLPWAPNAFTQRIRAIAVVKPSKHEIENNVRARSAILRVAEKVND